MPEIADACRRIADEHAALRTLLDRIDGACDLHRLMPELEALRELLRVHFAGEEADDGLHTAVGDRAPALFPAIEALFEEHRRFDADLDDLIQRGHGLLAGPVAAVRRGACDLTRRLRAHEERENDLFGEAVYTDLGGRG